MQFFFVAEEEREYKCHLFYSIAGLANFNPQKCDCEGLAWGPQYAFMYRIYILYYNLL